MSQYNELEQALKVADNPALGSTTERILAAEVRRLQAVNQTINAIWEEVDAYARKHSELQLGESVSGHVLKLMRERDELRDRASKYQRNYAVLYDRLNGTPCAEIRWQSEREQLIERAEKAESELAKAREQKPAGYVFGDWRGATTISAVKSSHFNTPLYAAPVPAVAAPAVPRKYHEFASVMLDAQPFITAETYGGRYIVAMRFERLGKMQDCHAALLALLQSAHVTDSVAAKQSQIDSLVVPDNFRAAAMSYLSAVDKFNELNSTAGGGWSTKKAGTHQEIVSAANEMHGRRKLLEAMLQSATQSGSDPVAHHPV